MSTARNGESVLRFENVSVSFDGVPALVDVSFDARTAHAHIILGAAGSGKTVVLKTAMGLVRPESGKVFVFDQDITTLSERELFGIRSKIGMLFQESALFDSHAGLGLDRSDAAGRDRPKLVLHLHRFHDDEPLPGPDLVARLHGDSNDQSRHRGDQWRGPRGRRGCARKLANRSRALVERFNVEAEAVEP